MNYVYLSLREEYDALFAAFFAKTGLGQETRSRMEAFQSDVEWCLQNIREAEFDGDARKQVDYLAALSSYAADYNSPERRTKHPEAI